MHQRLEEVGDGERGGGVVLYSAHDSTLMAALHAWGLTEVIDEHGWPPYAAALRLDLLKTVGEGSLWVRVSFAGRPVLCGERDVWPFEAFLGRAEGFMM